MMLILLAALAHQPPSNTPRAFLERVYAEYRDPNFDPFDHLSRYFAPALIAAIREDERLAKGEVGYVDGDPICQCQDPGGMRASVVKVTEEGSTSASALVSLGFAGEKSHPVRFSLVKTASGWRIADVSSADEPSLRRSLEKSNREQRARH